MKVFRRLSVILTFSLIILLPKIVALACGPWPAAPEEFRLWLFQPNIGDAGNEFNAYYFSMLRFYKQSNGEDFAIQVETDQNFREWQTELKADFSKKDFYNAVQTYSYKLCKDSANDLRKTNSFINSLLRNSTAEYFDYFLSAKNTERFNTFGASQDPWGLEENASNDAILLVHSLEKMLSQTKNKFVRQRTAYLLCRVLFYGKRTEAFKKIYETYFANAATSSWVNAAAKYYYLELINAKDANPAVYYRGLVDVIDQSKDKRMISIKKLEDVDKKKLLSYMLTKHQQATALASFAIRYPAYALNDIKEIYALDPHNKFLPVLITREINKLEDWLLTPVLTEYATSASKENWSESKWFQKQNLIKDSIYAQALKKLLGEMSASYPKERADLTIDICHINFLLKDLTAAQKCCEIVLANADKNSSAYVQAKINKLIINWQQKQKLDDVLKNEIYNMLTYLDKNSLLKNMESLRDYSIKDALLVYLGRSVLKSGDIANAALLLSGTYKPWGEYRTGEMKSAYFILSEYAKEKDFDAMLAILKKADQTPYEKYFSRIKTVFSGNYSVYPALGYSNENYTEHSQYYWNINKVLDLKGTYFVNKDSLEKALTTFKQVPGKFWKDTLNVYQNYLTGDPFNLNVYDPHEHKSDHGVKNDPDKAHFIERLIACKQKALTERDPEAKAKLYYHIGNAYYSMSYYGKFWLMSKLWWGLEEYDMDRHVPVDGLNYYSTSRAKYYYQQAFALTKDPQKAAFYCIYIGCCERNKKAWQVNKTREEEESIFGNPTTYTAMLKQKPHGDLFYKRLIKECPLYSDFRMRLK